MNKIRTETVNVLDYAEALASQLLKSTDDIERTEHFEEHGQCWVRAYYVEECEDDDQTFSVVECGEEGEADFWFELETL